MQSPPSLEALIEEVKNDPSDLGSCSALEKLCGYVDDLSQKITKTSDTRVTDELQSFAITLWNTAVTRKTGKNLEKNANAKLRHCACLLVFHDNGPTQNNPVLLKRQIMMAIKTSRAWLDSDSPLLADTSLNWAMQSVERFKSFLEAEAEDSESRAAEMKELEKSMLKMLTYRVECACIQDNTETAMEALQSAKYLLPKMPKEAPYLCVMCYNLGCAAYKKKQFKSSAMWLRESIELGKDERAVGSENQAKSLRLLATVYIDWDIKQYMQKALNAVGLANAEYCHPVGLYLKLRILLKGDFTDSRIQSALEDIIRHSDLEIDTAIQTINLLAASTRYDLAFDMCKKITMKFQTSPQVGQVLLLHLEMLLEKNMRQAAKDMIEDSVTGTLQMLDIDTKTKLHIMLWKQAASAFEGDDFSESLTWYNYSLSLFSNSDKGNKNLAKLQRNRASCFLALNNLAKAEEAIGEAVKHDVANCYSYFLVYKVALMKGQDTNAIEAIKKMCEERKEKPQDITENVTEEEQNQRGLICLAAQLAFEEEFLNLALSHVDDCRTICQKLKTAVDPEKPVKDTTAVLIVLYEFEALARLGRAHKLMDVLEKAIALPYRQTKMFETLAGLCMQTSVAYKDVALKALNIAFEMHMASDIIDFKKCSKVIHSLVELTSQNVNKSTGTNNDKCWDIFKKSLEIIEQNAKGEYPEVEIQWLMIKAWNTGIHMYSAGQHVEAEKWCSMSLQFLHHLPTMRSNYEAHMNNIYAEILSKIEKNQAKVGTEE
ncbi:testis-expressed protein 11-like [Anneissia japonica]|uniref:testis-expressed protein 11-like n=1 Tax=Anneissia japonica TaxID=1529436 RepID=UPI00142562CE|nr:testis-expressed protein 11-like [Anneissia japonica]